MVNLYSFFVSVMASVAAYYICKWLDGKRYLWQSARGISHPAKNGIEKPQRSQRWGFLCINWHIFFSFDLILTYISHTCKKFYTSKGIGSFPAFLVGRWRKRSIWNCHC